jgi:hypothetical protein
MGVMNPDGSMLIPTNNTFITPAWIDQANPKLFYVVKDNKLNFIDLTGKQVMPTEFEPIREKCDNTNFTYPETFFSDGILNVLQKGRVVLINTQGQLLANQAEFGLSNMDIRFRKIKLGEQTLIAAIFEQGNARLLRFKLNGKFYDTAYDTGILSSGALFNEHNGTDIEDLLVVRANGRWGYLNARGEEVLPLIYDNATPFRQGIAYIQQGNTFEVINRDGVALNHFDPAITRMRRSKTWTPP